MGGGGGGLCRLSNTLKGCICGGRRGGEWYGPDNLSCPNSGIL